MARRTRISRARSSSRTTPAIDLLAFRLRWYDRWLKGDQNGVDDDAPVLLYIMGTGDDRRSAAAGCSMADSGAASANGPSPGRATAYHLHADGTLAQARSRAVDAAGRPIHLTPSIRCRRLAAISRRTRA